MAPLHISLRVVCFREGDTWFAHCLEFDLIGDGPTQAEAVAQLAEAIRIQMEFSVAHDNPNNLFAPADGDLFLRFAAGRKSNIAVGDLLLRIDPITVEAAEIVLEDADDFDKEVRLLGKSKKFGRFLKERSKEAAPTSLEDYRRSLD